MAAVNFELRDRRPGIKPFRDGGRRRATALELVQRVREFAPPQGWLLTVSSLEMGAGSQVSAETPGLIARLV
jgi:hypothetical protein